MLLFVLILLIFASGCVSDTGQASREEFFDEERTLAELNILSEANKTTQVQAEPPKTEDNKSTQNVTNQTKPVKPVPAEKVTCRNVTKACPDGFRAACQCCGNCTTCEPDCAGHNVCVENWSCSEWSECAEGSQTRTCSDASNCGTDMNKPDETRDCEEPEPQGEKSVIISEIMYYASGGSDTHGEFIELYNNGTTSADLSAWNVSDDNGSYVLLGFSDGPMVLESGRHAVITGRKTDVNVPTDAIHLITGGYICTNGLKKAGEDITLLAPAGTIADMINYGEFPTCNITHSLERTTTGWECSTTENGTPGYKNSY